MTPFKLKIITPEKVFFDGETEQIIVRTTVGDVGILNGHEPYCAALGIGQLRSADTRHHNNIVAGQHIALVQAVQLPETAADTVAHHGVTQLCGHGDAQTAHPLPVFQAIDHHTAGDG